MKVLDQQDDRFLAEALNEPLRQEAIVRLTRARNGLFVGAVVMNLAFLTGLVFFVMSGLGGVVLSVQGFVAAVAWIQVIKQESDLRLLKLVDRINQGQGKRRVSQAVNG